MQTCSEAKFYFPAGIGRHVDHLICRDVALDLLRTHPSAKIVFYEDTPYWWLRFLKNAQYRELGLDPSAAQAGRSSDCGVGLRHYLLRSGVPFPRGRKLFLAVFLGLLARAGRGASADLRMFNPTISTVTVDAEILSRKRDLVYQYRSQLPMLFGAHADDLLRMYRECFATETTIEL
jgi:hypothetical protein